MTIFITILILAIIFLAIFWVISTFFSIYGGSVYLGTKPEVVRAAFQLAGLKKNETMYELGSGLGNGLIIASEEFGARAVGLEISPFYYCLSRFRTVKYHNIRIIFKNFKNFDLSCAQVIYCYLVPSVMKALAPRFARQLQPGSRVVTNTFQLSGRKPDLVKKIANCKIYLYKF